MKFCWKLSVLQDKEKLITSFVLLHWLGYQEGSCFTSTFSWDDWIFKPTAKKVYNKLRNFCCFKHTKLGRSFSTTLIGNREGSCLQKYILGMHNKLLQNNCKRKEFFFEKTCLLKTEETDVCKKENLLPPLLTHGQTTNLGSCFMNVQPLWITHIISTKATKSTSPPHAYLYSTYLFRKRSISSNSFPTTFLLMCSALQMAMRI